MKPITTAISSPESDRVTVRGFDLANELIGNTSTSEYYYVLLTGRRPSSVQSLMLDACIVSIAEHGLVPSVQVARMTYASAPEALHGAVAAGLLGCGSVILGSSDVTARLLAAIVAECDTGRLLPEIAHEHVARLHDRGVPVPGVGHPLHRVEDPRATALLKLAQRHNVYGQHCKALAAVVASLPHVYGRTFPLNASGVIPAVLLDVGFPVNAMKGVPLIGRTMSLMAHLLEEEESPIGFALADAAASAAEYVGTAPGSEAS